MAEKIDFISLVDTSPEMLRHFLAVARKLKKQLKETGHIDPVAEGEGAGVYFFEKPSLRTRVSFGAAMYHLGGMRCTLRRRRFRLGTRESVPDVALRFVRDGGWDYGAGV